jgi:hypothetical protein
MTNSSSRYVFVSAGAFLLIAGQARQIEKLRQA